MPTWLIEVYMDKYLIGFTSTLTSCVWIEFGMDDNLIRLNMHLPSLRHS